MSIASTSAKDASMVLCDEYTEEPQAEKQTSPFPFPTLETTLQSRIAAQLDKPTHCSLSWTCRPYRASYGDPNFDPFAFADKCAELGYRTLLEYSVARGGAFDDETTKVAAAHGQLDVLQLYVKHAHQNCMKVDFKNVSRLVEEWAVAAARTGRLNVLEWVRVKYWREVSALDGVAQAAMEVVPETALGILEQVKQFDTESSRRSGKLASSLMSIAYAKGDLTTVQRLLDMGHHHIYLFYGARAQHPDTIAKYCGGRFDLETDLPKLLHWGIEGFDEANDVKLIELAEKYGAVVTVKDFHPENVSGCRFPQPHVLRYMHQKFNLSRAPFTEAYEIPNPISKADMQWMLDQGYQFTSTNFFPTYWNIELLPHLLQLGFKPTSADILEVAIRYRFDLLDAFWQAKAADFVPDDTSIAKFLNELDIRVSKALERFQLKRNCFQLKHHLRVIQWFLQHGYTHGTETAPYDKFICTLLEHRPRLFKDYWSDLHALNMPLSDATHKRVAEFLANSRVRSQGA